MVLGTTTWRYRNNEQLILTRNIAKERGIYNPTIIEYGPGGAINFLMKLLPAGNKPDWSNTDKIQRGIVKIVESALRKTNLFELESSETLEIDRIFKELFPNKIYVIDKEQKVITSIRHKIHNKEFSTHISGYIMDIQEQAFDKQGEIVIAYNIIQRTSNPEKTLENIANSTCVGGILSTTSKITPKGFEQIKEGIYLRKY
jgi:hypothetical protein